VAEESLCHPMGKGKTRTERVKLTSNKGKSKN